MNHHTRHRNLILGPAIILCAIFILFPLKTKGAIIADHNAVDEFDQIPEEFIQRAKKMFRIAYGHTSHGAQIITGMNLLNEGPGSRYCWNFFGSDNCLALFDGIPQQPGLSDARDLGNPDRTLWEQETRAFLGDPLNPNNNRNVIMWAWCGQVDTIPDNIQIYLNLMDGLIRDYPNVTFIFMTGHLNGTGEEGNLSQRNNQIRDHVIATNGILFDFADIESYDPDGNYYLDKAANDNCDYIDPNTGTLRNWAIDWCNAHPGECASCNCIHSQCLNCQMKAKAFWWLMAKLAGWEVGSKPNPPKNLRILQPE